jgi:hypothetical protein
MLDLRRALSQGSAKYAFHGIRTMVAAQMQLSLSQMGKFGQILLCGKMQVSQLSYFPEFASANKPNRARKEACG